MKQKFKNITYDTNTAKYIGTKSVGEFGVTDGYEEKLFVTDDNNYFIYGIGGSDSIYSESEIRPITEKEAKEWKKDNDIE